MPRTVLVGTGKKESTAAMLILVVIAEAEPDDK
jgi:hypothetical protein